MNVKDETKIIQIRQELLRHIYAQIDFVENSSKGNFRERLELLAFSILVVLDGKAGTFPRVDIVVNDLIINQKLLHDDFYKSKNNIKMEHKEDRPAFMQKTPKN